MPLAMVVYAGDSGLAASGVRYIVGMSICTLHHPRMAFSMWLLNQQSSDTGWRSLAAHLFSSARDWSSSVPPPSTTAQVMHMENGRTPTRCSGSSFGALAFFSARLYRHFLKYFFFCEASQKNHRIISIGKGLQDQVQPSI